MMSYDVIADVQCQSYSRWAVAGLAIAPEIIYKLAAVASRR